MFCGKTSSLKKWKYLGWKQEVGVLGGLGEGRGIKGYSFGSGFERKAADLRIVLGLWQLGEQDFGERVGDSGS